MGLGPIKLHLNQLGQQGLIYLQSRSKFNELHKCQNKTSHRGLGPKTWF